MKEKKKKPKIRVLEWPAVPVPTPEEVYGITTEEKDRILGDLKERRKKNTGRDNLEGN